MTTLSSLPLELTESTIETQPSASIYGANYYVRQLISNAVQKDTSITNFHRELLRNLKNLFASLYIKDSQNQVTNIKCVHGLSERAIAKQLSSKHLILPLLAINQSNSFTDSAQAHYGAITSCETIWDDKKQRAIRIVSLVPKPITVVYSLAVWANYTSHLDQLSEQIHRMFNPYLEVNLPFTKYGKIFLGQESNEYSTDLPDKEDRVLIRSYEIKVETHIPSPKFLMTSTGQLEVFNVEGEIYDEPRD